MKTFHIRIGSHHVQVLLMVNHLSDFLIDHFEVWNDVNNEPDILLSIKEGFRSSVMDLQVSITKDSEKIYFRRSDYLIETAPDYKCTTIYVSDELPLKHALTNFYSSYIVYHNWGLILHSSCVLEDGRAHIFAGQSGAGKSTAARLSKPRDLLSDEASLVKITDHGITVYHSPFRSEETDKGRSNQAPLESIQILHQSPQNERVNMKKADAFVHLLDKVFYWSHDSEETKKIMGLLKLLVDRVPVYELYFKKDNTFWELIS
jgi:hypothetical protein